MINNNSRVLTSIALMSVSTILSVNSTANEYSFEYSVQGGYEYNDNIGLRSEDEIDVSGGVITAPATLTIRSERLETSLIGELTSAKYDDSDFDSDDQNLEGRTQYLLERGELTGYAGYKRDSTRTSEFLDTGIVGLRATRVEHATAGGSVDYMFTEKNGLVAGVDYLDRDYDSPLQTDFDNISGYAGWRHQQTERTSLRLQVIAARYENDANLQVTSDSVGAQVGFDSELSEALNVFLLVGWVNVDTDYSANASSIVTTPDDDSNDVFQMNGSLVYRQERNELSLEVSSGTRATGSGTLDESHRLNLSYNFRWTEGSRLRLALVGGKNSSLDSDVDDDRDYARGRIGVDYRIAESWYLGGTYTYSYQDRQRADGDADSNQIDLSLIFRPDRHVWSR
ncbi:MAG: hypothetical protein HRT77_00165 [Halioglobus sp.]|nr:hypothetical protein [Halioglobus sp.]